VRVLCNAAWFDGRVLSGQPVESRRQTARTLPGLIREYVGAAGWDAVVINSPRRQLYVFAALRGLLPFLPGPRRLVSVDIVLQRPRRGLRERVKRLALRFLLKRVDLFIFYLRDTAALQQIYGIPDAKIRYLPFKINDYDRLVTVQSEDGGYLLSCGRSRRDYATLARAMEGLPYRAVILVPHREEAAEHGTEADLTRLPPNVTIEHDDGSAHSWLEWMRRATLVVLPVLPETLSASGLGTYLQAMALGKCVIITENVGTRGILAHEQTAVIVPPRDAAALRAAITRVAEDADYRERIAAGGRAYALPLRDEQRLAGDIVREVAAFIDAAPDR
jgi:glycosyltransferase involved in cell wall biosynthesis